MCFKGTFCFFLGKKMFILNLLGKNIDIFSLAKITKKEIINEKIRLYV